MARPRHEMPAPAVRRPEAAGQHFPGARVGAEDPALRRGDERARSADDRRRARPAPRSRRHDRAHHPGDGRHPPHLRPRRRSRPCWRGWADDGGLPPSGHPATLRSVREAEPDDGVLDVTTATDCKRAGRAAHAQGREDAQACSRPHRARKSRRLRHCPHPRGLPQSGRPPQTRSLEEETKLVRFVTTPPGIVGKRFVFV